MDLNSWLKEYKEICFELDILAKDDYDSRDLAAEIIKDKGQPLGKLESLLKNRPVVVFGAGPSLEEGVKSLDKGDKTLIAADGATSCLLENGIYPDIVVTDLDGEMKDLLLADRFGCLMIVHAHGDNQDKIERYLREFKNPIVTTQVEPLDNVHNFFGFTDGDRSVLMARYFGAKEIELVGFDFDGKVGKYSDPENPTVHEASERKKKKLEIAKRLIG